GEVGPREAREELRVRERVEIGPLAADRRRGRVRTGGGGRGDEDEIGAVVLLVGEHAEPRERRRGDRLAGGGEREAGDAGDAERSGGRRGGLPAPYPPQPELGSGMHAESTGERAADEDRRRTRGLRTIGRGQSRTLEDRPGTAPRSLRAAADQVDRR